MTSLANSFTLWLADYYLLATVLLCAALVTLRCLKQPAHRLAITKSTLTALFLLAALCAIPGWSLIHVLTSEPPQASESPAPTTITETSAPQAPFPTTPLPIEPLTTPPAIATPPSLAPPNTNWRDFPWPRIIAATHLTGAAGVCAWLALGALAANRLQRTAHPASPELVALFTEVAALQKYSPPLPSLKTSDRIQVAVALGIFRPTVLLPTRWLQSHSAAQLRTVLAHELAHIANHDLRWLAAGRALLILLWAQPLLWLARRRMRLDQETLADAAAADLTSRQHYAEQLLTWARNIPARQSLPLSAAVGLWEGPSQLRQRIAVLLDERFTVFRQCSRRWRMATLAIAGLAAVSLSIVTLEKAQSQPDEDRSEPTADSTNQPSKATNPPPPSQTATPAGPVMASPWGEFRVIPGAQPNVIAGRCVDENGAPLSGLKVLLLDFGNPDQVPDVKHETTTDASGNYRFENVVDLRTEFPNGRIPIIPQIDPHFLQVLTRGAGRVTTLQLATTVDVARSGQSLEHTLRPAATLRGRVTGPDGRPVVGALVAVGPTMFTRFEGMQASRTDADGRYEINDVAPFDIEKFRAEQEAQRQRNQQSSQVTGELRPRAFATFSTGPPMISVEHPDFALLKAPCEQIPGTKDVQLESAAIIEGRVVYADSGQPAANVRLRAQTQPSQSLSPSADFVYRMHNVYARTDNDGKFRITTLPEGTYDLWPLSDEWLHPRVAVRTQADQVTTIPELRLTRGSIVRIRLVSATDGKPVAVGPDDEASFFVQQVVGRLFSEAPTQTVKPQADGTFEARAVPGRNVVTLRVVVSGDQVKWIASGQRPNLIDVPIDEKETVSVDLPVEPASPPREQSDGRTSPPAAQSDDARKPTDAELRSGFDDKFAFFRVTTELQRSLLGNVAQPENEAALCVFVNYAAFSPGEVEAQSPAFKELSQRLAEYAADDSRHATFLVLTTGSSDTPFEQRQNEAFALAKLCEEVGRASGYKRAKWSCTFGDPLNWDWKIYIDGARSAAKLTNSPPEQSVGDSQVRVFPVHTHLSRLLANADCVVNVTPIVRHQKGTRFPDDFLPSILQSAPQLEYEQQHTMLIRVRFAESARLRLEEWVDDRPGREAFANAFGFETCNLQQSFTNESENEENPAAADTDGASQPIEIPIIVAQHVLLHDGKIIEWADVEKLITALPNPKLAHPGFYFTHGALAERQEEIRGKIWDLRKRIELNGHSWGSISPRTSPRYDAIRTPADLAPDESLRVSGTVETADGLPIDGAEVVLLTPAPESVPYKTLDVYLRNERLRQPLDEVVTRSDNSGRFALYPQPETPHYLIALHREGFGLVRSDEFARSQRIVIAPWARVRGQVQEDARYKQSASLRAHLPADDKWPELTFHQYSVDLGPLPPSGEFEFAFVPPQLPGTLSRSVEGEQGTSFGLPAKEFKLSPGETLIADITPLSADPAARLELLKAEQLKAEEERRRKEADAARAAETPQKNYTFPINISGRALDAAGNPIAGAEIYLSSQLVDSKRIAQTRTDESGYYSIEKAELPI